MCKTIRLNSIVAKQFSKTDREARNLISKGLVKVAGVTQSEPGFRVQLTEPVTLEKNYNFEYLYYAVNKPVGLLTFPNRLGERAASHLLPEKPEVFNIGRLDADSSGLLIFTNDGRLTPLLLNANSTNTDVEKEYLVEVSEFISDNILKKLEYGMNVLGTFSKPLRVTRISGKEFAIVLTEGKNRQIRRMCRTIGMHVVKLHRFRIGNYVMPLSLSPGKFLSLDIKEVELLCYPNEMCRS